MELTVQITVKSQAGGPEFIQQVAHLERGITAVGHHNEHPFGQPPAHLAQQSPGALERAACAADAGARRGRSVPTGTGRSVSRCTLS